jgi:hypothetical protein
MSNADSVINLLAQQDAQRTQQDQASSAGGNAEKVIGQIATGQTETKGPTIGPQLSQQDVPMFGYSWQSPEQRITMPLAKVLMAAHDKLREVENFTQEGREAHPIQAKIGDVADAIEGFLFGGAQQAQHNIGTGQYGMVNNPVTAAVSTVAPAAELAEGAEAGVNAWRAARTAKSTAEGSEAAPGIVKQVLKGKEVAQEPAQTALRSGAQSSAADAGVTVSTEEGAGVRTLMQKPIEAAAKIERALYDTLNDAAETDMKSLFDRKQELLDALDDPTNVANRTALSSELSTTEKAIKVHSDLAASKGLPPDMLEKAKAATQQRYAMQDLEQKLFNNESVVSGNVEHGSPESINVDSAIRQVENLDKPSKFAPRGTPTRLVQALGEDGAAKLKQGLYDAQKSGQSALKVQQIAKWIGGIAGVGAIGEVVKHVMP